MKSFWKLRSSPEMLHDKVWIRFYSVVILHIDTVYLVKRDFMWKCFWHVDFFWIKNYVGSLAWLDWTWDIWEGLGVLLEWAVFNDCTFCQHVQMSRVLWYWFFLLRWTQSASGGFFKCQIGMKTGLISLI